MKLKKIVHVRCGREAGECTCAEDLHLFLNVVQEVYEEVIFEREEDGK